MSMSKNKFRCLAPRFFRAQRFSFFLVWITAVAVPCTAGKRPFTVLDDIALAHFGDPYGGEVDAVSFSPNRKYFVVATERGLVAKNRPESTLRLYNTQRVRQFLQHPAEVALSQPLWTISRATYPDGPIVRHVRWLPDSSGFAFLQTNSRGFVQVFLANFQGKHVRPLTPDDQYVTAFDVHSANSFVYVALSQRIFDLAAKESESARIVGTGRILYTLLFPTDLSLTATLNDLSELWAVVNGKRIRVVDKVSHRPIPLHFEASKVLSLAPDGRSVVTAVAVKEVPPEWEMFPTRMPNDPFRIRAGQQDLEAIDGALYASEYARIKLPSGEVAMLTNAPIGEYAGWWSAPLAAVWSKYGEAIVLSNTFLTPTPLHRYQRPCIVIVTPLGEASCLEELSGSSETDDRKITGVRLVEDGANQVEIAYAANDGSESSTVYKRSGHESWIGTSDTATSSNALKVFVKQDLNNPPVLVAANTGGNSQVILDPNPQLTGVELSEASLYKWADKSGRNWVGGLYKPHGYISGKRYPLVVQTHGFHPHEFRPDGVYPTSFAAQELAASGIMVLQAPDCPISMDSKEGPCSVGIYESAVEALDRDGFVDRNELGIIGFSRTCYYVMDALTTSKIHFTAASITDGFNFGYFQYLIDIDLPGNGVVGQANAMMGAPAFGEGLQRWLQRSPEFNLDKVTTPLQVVVTRHFLVDDWEPYAGLRVLNKPVDLIVLRNGTHVLNNPAERVASQGGTVDWFRFWLLNEEDPSQLKSAQYRRWRQLRALSLRQTELAPQSR